MKIILIEFSNQKNGRFILIGKNMSGGSLVLIERERERED